MKEQTKRALRVENLRGITARWKRPLCVLLAATLFFSAAAVGLREIASAAAGSLAQSLRQIRGPFTDRPRLISFGSDHRRDPSTRGGMWSSGALQDADLSKLRGLYASVAPSPLAGQHTLSVEAAPGSGLPWEGSSSPPGGGTLNTANGNKLTTVPLVSFKDRGGMTVDFTLYHNSQTDYNDELGHNWTWTYDIYIYEGQSSAIVHWGDGTAIPFTPTGGGAYSAPTGIYDTLVKNGDDTWTVTTKDQTTFEFNDDGFCNEIADRNGNTITFTLNQYNYVTRITAPSGRYIDIDVDGSNNFTGITDPLGREWSFNLNGTTDRLDSVEYPLLDSTTYTDEFSYDSSSRITTHTDRRDKDWTFTYNTDGSLASAATPLSHTTSYSYASGATTVTFPGSQTMVCNYSSGKLSSVVDQASFSESYSYNGSKQVTSRTDRRSKTWSYTYDSRGNVLTVTNPLSKVWTHTYSSDNDLLTAEDPLDNVTTYDYDAYGNLETVTDPLDNVTVTNTYDAYGQIETSTNGEDETTTFDFDTYGNLVSVIDPLTNETEIAWDALSRVTSSTDPNSNSESIAYDEWERPATITHEDDTMILYAYNEVNQITVVTNELGNATTYTYDNSGRLTQLTNANSESETYAYNSNGWRTSVTNGRNKTRTYTFTSRGEVYTLTLPDSSVETWSYNGNSQVSAYTNPLSQTIGYTFDDAGRMTGADYPAGTDTSFGYDDADRRTSMVDAVGTTAWTYNDASQLEELDPPQGLIDYTYDLAGRRATMDEDGVGSTTYSYDAAGHLTSVENPFSETTTFDYDAGGRLTGRDLGNGTYELPSYDTRNRVTQILLKNSSHSTLQTQTWTYDDGSNVATHVVSGVTTTFEYDDIDQLTSESRSGYSASYTYDANGNRATKTLGGTTQTYNYDDADKLTSITQGGNTVKSFSYDTAGRTTGVTVSGNTTTLAYDYESRITTITYPNQSTNTFTYNGLDTRVGKVDSGGTKTFLRDGAGVTDPVINDSAASYTPGVSERRSGTSTFYHGGIKNAESQTAANESVAATVKYDAFGLVVNSSGTWKGPFGYGGPFGYQEDVDSGLKLLGHRYLDPSTGRFLTRDPVKDGRNWYGYVGNNPVEGVDPAGLWNWNYTFHAIIAGFNIWINGGGITPPPVGLGGPYKEHDQIVRIAPRPSPVVGGGTPPPPSPRPLPVKIGPREIVPWEPPVGGGRIRPGVVPRPTGSGGGVGAIVTVVMGADVAYRGIGEIIKYRGKIQSYVDELYE